MASMRMRSLRLLKTSRPGGQSATCERWAEAKRQAPGEGASRH
jgi:hypothetical protein